MMTSPPDASAFTAHYEAVRGWAVARPRPPLCPAGAALLLHRGVAAWLGAWPTWQRAAPPAPAAPGAPTAAPTTVAGRARALAGVLATMVEHCQQEQEESA